jgi:hypothetical protein
MGNIKVLFLFFFFLQAIGFAQEKNLLATNLEYKNGITLYKSKNYKESFVIFDRLIKQYPTDEKINFYYARSAFELQNYETAFIIFDRILINNPLNHRARLEYARTLFMLKQYDNAKLEFEKVLNSPIPVQVRKNVEKFLTLIEKKKKRFFINNVAIFGLNWDNNIDNATYEYNNNLINGLTNSNTQKKKDYSFKNILLSNIVAPSQSNQKLAWDSTIVSYMQEQKQYHANDIYLLSIASGLSYLENQFKNTTSALYDVIWVGGDKSFYNYGVKNTYQYKIDNKQMASCSLSYKKKKYVSGADQDKDSNTKSIGLEYSLLLDNKGKLTFATNTDIVRKEKGTRTDVSKDSHSFKIGYEKPFLETYTYNLSYKFEDSDYTIASVNGSNPLPKREDDQHTLSVKVTHKIDKKQNVSCELSRIDNRSNNNIYSYKKNKVGMNYMVLF